MYTRKDKSEKFLAGCQEGIQDLFRLLESSDPQEVESVKNVIHENLSSVKDSSLLNCIVDYYRTLNSERALDILARVKDPHDRHLFDKINELMKSETTCYESLQLLCNLVYRQPNWIHRINHRLMNSLFQLLKTDMHAPNLISALFIVVCLLPMIPSQFGRYLNDTFCVFSRLMAWNVKKPSSMSETLVLHLQVGVYSLFHRLYGMFPCNFLAYLRSFYGGRAYNEDNMKVFTLFIKPMLERVRLHPLLVTASKETETSVNRWKKMEYHDVLTECATISLDAIEGTLDGLRGRNQNLNDASRRQSTLGAQNSLQYVSLSSQSSVMSASVEPVGLVGESTSSHRESLWSSYTPAPSSVFASKAAYPLINKTDSEARVSQTTLEPIPLDLAVEARPEEPKDIESQSVSYMLSKSSSSDLQPDFKLDVDESNRMETNIEGELPVKKDFDNLSDCPDSSFEKSILQAVEAKEEDIDKEVSDLTSSNKFNEGSLCEIRNNTPFCSTTQNLTDEPPNLAVCPVPTLDASGSLTKNQEDDVDEMYTSMQDETCISFSRFRYTSHCGLSVVPCTAVKAAKVVRSNSCPSKFCSSPSLLDSVPNVATTTVVATCSKNAMTTCISNDLIFSTSTNLSYEQLIPMAMYPLPNITQPSNSGLESSYHSYNALFTSLSPPELLDNYVQLGSDTYVASIPITSTKSTDWTHFGGKPPPDEIDILRKQIILLHNQLLFERHRKDVHSERIRRIFGRGKKSRMQEELIVALKEQINLLETDSENFKHELSITNKIFDSFKSEKAQVETDLNNFIRKIKLENVQLLFDKKKLQNTLVTQKEENDKILKDLKLYQGKIHNLDTELKLCQQEIDCYRKLKKDSEFQSKQLFLLQEINDLYKEKLDHLKDPNEAEIGESLTSIAAIAEIKDLKIRLESACIQQDAANSKITGLEQILSNMKQKEKEHLKKMEEERTRYKAEMGMHEEYCTTMNKIIVSRDNYILQMHKEQEMLQEKLKNMEKKFASIP